MKAERYARIHQLCKSLLEIESDMKELNVKVALESLPRPCIGNTLADMEQILDGMNEDIFGVCL